VIFRTADGVRIGVVAGTFGTNGFPLPAGRAVRRRLSRPSGSPLGRDGPYVTGSGSPRP
jgi:hypothetical protein